MLQMVKYEWRKIWKSKLTALATLGCVLLLAFGVYSSIAQLQTWNDSGERVYGLSAVKVLKNRGRIKLTQEKIDEIVSQYLEYTKNPDTNSENEAYGYLSEEIYQTFYYPNKHLIDMIARGYGYDGTEDYKIIFEKNIGKDFYQARIETIKNYITKEENNGDLTSAEAAYWIKEAEKTGVYDYGYFAGWDLILDSVSWPLFIMMVICIGIAPVFAGEYQSKCDSLLLCMKYGKNKLIASKIISVWLYTSCVYWGIVLSYSAFYLSFLGTEGGDLPIQLNYPEYNVVYSLTMKEAAILALVMAYFCTLGMMGLTLLLSSLLKNPYGVIVIDVILLVVPSFFNFNEGGYLFMRLLDLLPAKIVDLVYYDYISYDLGGKVLDWPRMAILVDGIGAVVFSILSYFAFRKHQVNK